MLTKGLWRTHEPRFGFPIFKGAKTLVSFSIRSDFSPRNYRRLAGLARDALRHGFGAAFGFVREYAPLFVSAHAKCVRFRMIITSRDGKLLGVQKLPGLYPPGGSIDVDVGCVCADLGLARDDYMGIIVMSRGRPDPWNSSPGSFSITYVGERFYTTYRTGAFARSLNDRNRRRHVGFRGINPKIVANDRAMSSLLLINHSSNPLYDETATPRSLLVRPDGVVREACFGPVPPFGGVERSLEELFGEDVADFLAPFEGQGTTVTTCPGFTLASLHVMRSRGEFSMAIEHSRPTHTYLLYGVG